MRYRKYIIKRCILSGKLNRRRYINMWLDGVLIEDKLNKRKLNTSFNQ